MAKLQRVLIRNFRNVTQRELELDTDFIVSGQNMSGKTNTLNAIHWAFTGATLEGSNDNRANFPINDESSRTSVVLDFGDFTFERYCEMVDYTPTVKIKINGIETPSVKNGEAQLHAKLELSDIILQNPKFNIVRFLLNPLYFDTLAPKELRKFLYKLADINFQEIADQQNGNVKEVINKYLNNEPYALLDAIDKSKKQIKKSLDIVKGAPQIFPSVTEEAAKKEKELNKSLKTIESDEALADKFALAVSKRINVFFQKAMGIKVCLLEKGVGDDVFKDVCYPILPKSGLPFDVGSYAERSYVGIRFIQEVCLKWNIKPLPILLDNMESLDENTSRLVNELGVQYIGALVK